MAAPDLTLNELAEMITARIAREAGRKFTGQIRFTAHLRSGGIGRLQCEINEDMHREDHEKSRG